MAKSKNYKNVVYVVHAPEVKRVKIGYAGHLLRRLNCLQVGSPCKLEIIHVYLDLHCQEHSSYQGRYDAQVNNKCIELVLHDLFSEYRLHGEWFKDDVIDLLPKDILGYQYHS